MDAPERRLTTVLFADVAAIIVIFTLRIIWVWGKA